MAVRFRFAAGFRRGLARSQVRNWRITRRRPLANRFTRDRVARPLMGLLALPCIFPAATLHFCCGARTAYSGGLGSFPATRSFTVSADILRQPAVEEGVQ